MNIAIPSDSAVLGQALSAAYRDQSSSLGSHDQYSLSTKRKMATVKGEENGQQ